MLNNINLNQIVVMIVPLLFAATYMRLRLDKLLSFFLTPMFNILLGR
jgi:hypothetical protein